MELAESNHWLFAATCKWVDPYIEERDELRYLPFEATLDIMIVLSSITHLTLKVFVTNHLKHWDLNA